MNKYNALVHFADALSIAVTSRRSDLEILGYVMLQWLCDRLPWENNLENKEYVKNEKIRYIVHVKPFLLQTNKNELTAFGFHIIYFI